jgi:hypothetical protein
VRAGVEVGGGGGALVEERGKEFAGGRAVHDGQGNRG